MWGWGNLLMCCLVCKYKAHNPVSPDCFQCPRRKRKLNLKAVPYQIKSAKDTAIATRARYLQKK